MHHRTQKHQSDQISSCDQDRTKVILGLIRIQSMGFLQLRSIDTICCTIAPRVGFALPTRSTVYHFQDVLDRLSLVGYSNHPYIRSNLRSPRPVFVQYCLANWH